MNIGIFGAGSIGCYVGGQLLAASQNVTLLGRPRLQTQLTTHGLTVSHYEGSVRKVFPQQISFVTTPEALKDINLLIVTVKSQDTEHAAKEIQTHIPNNVIIVSLQNGVGNALTLQEQLPQHCVAAGMVPFNVVNLGDGKFHCGSEGHIYFEDIPETRELTQLLNAAHLPTRQHKNMQGVLWSKVILNLNNALNMLSDKPLKEELTDRNYRLVLAKTQKETLQVLKTAGITPVKIGKANPKLIPHIMSLPNTLFAPVMARLLKIDPKARSSMWEDMQAGRSPEIDYINGAVIALGEKLGVPTPANQAITALVKEAFKAGKSPALSGTELRNLILRL